MKQINALTLSIGDQVGVTSNGNWSSRTSVLTVARKTATQVILSDGTRWNKQGRKVSEVGAWSRSFLIPVPEARERMAAEAKVQQRSVLIRKIRELELTAVSEKGLLDILKAAANNLLTNAAEREAT